MGTAKVSVHTPFLKRDFLEEEIMRRKTKQLLATGMALAVLSSSALTVLAVNDTKKCDVMYYDGAIAGIKLWQLCKETATLDENSATYKDDSVHEWTYVCPKDHTSTKTESHHYKATWTKGNADKNGTGTMYLTVECEDCGHKFADKQAVTANSNTGTAATCEQNATYTYTAGSFSTVVNRQSFAYDNPVTLEESNSALGHKYTTYDDNNDATCTKDGTKTATCDNGCGATDTVTAEGTKLEHNFENAKPSNWEWSSDYSMVTVTLPCQNGNPDCTATTTDVTWDISYKVTKEPTCTAEGEATYTAYYNGYSDVKTKPLPKVKHVYSGAPAWSWNADHTTATATFTCDTCSEAAESTGIYGPIEVKRVEPTCTTEGSITYSTYVIDNGKKYPTEDVVTIPKLAHDCDLELEWDDDTCTSATATVKCKDCGYERKLDADDVKITSETTDPTCTKDGHIDYTAEASTTFIAGLEDGIQQGSKAQISGRVKIPATGHHFGAYTCTANGTEVAACEYCGAADVRPAGAETVCDHHNVDGTDVCPVCGKVNSNALLPQITADSNANTKAITSGAQLVVRAGTLPNGQKVLTVAYLDANGKVLTLNGSRKVRVPVAQLKAALGDAEGTGFEHTLTTADVKQTVGYAVENGSVVFDAAFNGSTAFVLLVD